MAQRQGQHAFGVTDHLAGKLLEGRRRSLWHGTGAAVGQHSHARDLLWPGSDRAWEAYLAQLSLGTELACVCKVVHLHGDVA